MDGGWVTHRGRHLAWVTLGASLAVVAIGCKSKTDAKPIPSAALEKVGSGANSSASAAASASAGPTGSASAAASGSPAGSASAVVSESGPLPRLEFNLIDPGSPPLRKLRYELTEGRKVRWTESSSERLEYQSVKLDGHPLPRSRWVYELVVSEAPKDGAAHAEVRVVEGAMVSIPGVPPNLANDLPKRNDAHRKAPRSGSVTVTGRVTPDEFSPPVDLDDQTRALMESEHDDLVWACFPLPEVAVGVGARWTVVRRFETRGVKLRELTVYELLKMEKDRIEFDGLVSASAPPTKLDFPRLPEGQTMELLRLSTIGKVRGLLTLTHPIPSVRSEWTTKMSIKVRHVDDIVGEGTVVLTGESTTVPDGMPTPPPIVDADEEAEKASAPPASSAE